MQMVAVKKGYLGNDAVMKNSLIHKFYMFGLALLFALSCRKDAPLPAYKECECEIDNVTTAHFRRDAVDMAYTYIRSDSTHPGFSDPIIYEETVIYFLGKLSAVFHEATNPESPLYEPVFKYQIHRSPIVLLGYLRITFTDQVLREQLLNTPGCTYNEKLNEYVLVYGFDLIMSSWVYPHSATIQSQNQYNVKAISNQLTGTPGISYVGTGYLGSGHSSTIDFLKTPEYLEFIFSYGWGDCLAGCASWHYWKVKVSKQCDVTFMGEWGDELPG